MTRTRTIVRRSPESGSKLPHSKGMVDELVDGRRHQAEARQEAGPQSWAGGHRFQVALGLRWASILAVNGSGVGRLKRLARCGTEPPRVTLVTGQGMARAVLAGLAGVVLFMVRFRVVTGRDDDRDTLMIVLSERSKPDESLQAWMNFRNC
jgi:hypothetical protein